MFLMVRKKIYFVFILAG